MSNPNQSAATRARNEEIERRLTAGENGPALAKEFGITQPRVHQIARAVREARGDLAPEAKPGPRIRPRLRKVELGLWLCAGGGIERRGETHWEAYNRWLKAFLAAHGAEHAATQVPKPPEPERPYAGPVTVVPGTKVAPRAFALSPAMEMVAQRARAAQHPLRSLAGIQERAA
ncbi:hypothetical protein [Achromobacter xylosoxidans]|uniref:Uncharacterized protein n=1 Tax=Alcaligenes xylosoxydans xylosoxydans TaxID=85698 RepID=A0A1R1JVR4_ALCXX|nr:hypothetical protein [Achromobacter xylosoxidans]OMG89737.1 hypothetical protein BIZ92_23260 [Achromobacter xylosoxidans]